MTAEEEKKKEVQPGHDTAGNGTLLVPEDGYDLAMRKIQEAMDRTAPESEEERKRRERREKWAGVISGIGDAVSSLGNLYFTTKGAPNMYDPKNSMSAKTRERYDKAKAEREARLKEHYNYAMRLGELKNAKAQREWQRWKETQENQRKDEELKIKQQKEQRLADHERAWQEYQAARTAYEKDKSAQNWATLQQRYRDWQLSRERLGFQIDNAFAPVTSTTERTDANGEVTTTTTTRQKERPANASGLNRGSSNGGSKGDASSLNRKK